MPSPRLALERFLVLDLTQARAGPNAVRQLADWGARVIRIEPPGDPHAGTMSGPRHGPDFQNLHRNKRCITLDLKAAAGREVFWRLAARADVLVENYRPGVKRRLGIDPEAVRRHHPGLVYGSISGFGQEGPYRDRPGFDQVAQGMGGLMSVTGLPGQGPVRAGIPVADLAAGLYLAQGILVALLEREASGEGQWVHTSLLQAMVAMMDFQAARWLIAGEVPPQAGNDHPTSIPTGVFPTADEPINIAASGDRIFARLCEALGEPALAGEPRFATAEARSAHRDALRGAIEARLAEDTAAAWVERLNAAGVPCGPIHDMRQVFADAQVRHLGLAAPVTHPVLGPLHVVAPPVTASRTPGGVRRAAPDKGADTDAVLGELGYEAGEIAALRARGVV